jgi:hypothetical protein
VPLIDIQPQRYRKILYDTPPRRGKIALEIEANSVLDVFIVPKSELERWRRGNSDYGGDGFLRKKSLQVQINIGPEFDDEWYLVLENKSDKVVTATYEVYEV